MKRALLPLVVLVALIAMNSCGEKTAVVESGIYQGTIYKVEPEKTEIYVELSDGRILELYFTDQTLLTKNDETVEFSVLAKGDTVEVQIEKIGKRLDPISVAIKGQHD
ncbi:MAG TPA: hypothetical protein PKW76_12210 [bacterium]|nr:hypothetical protein [bacterium]HPG46436.1 hypothetical protein [bacterium]HPM98651.1 hypothetical protein [bacterium]